LSIICKVLIVVVVDHDCCFCYCNALVSSFANNVIVLIVVAIDMWHCCLLLLFQSFELSAIVVCCWYCNHSLLSFANNVMVVIVFAVACGHIVCCCYCHHLSLSFANNELPIVLLAFTWWHCYLLLLIANLCHCHLQTMLLPFLLLMLLCGIVVAAMSQSFTIVVCKQCPYIRTEGIQFFAH